jgi:hypothetical protein
MYELSGPMEVQQSAGTSEAPILVPGPRSRSTFAEWLFPPASGNVALFCFQEQKDLNLFALFLSSTSFCSFSFLYIFLLLELRALWGERARSGRESAFVYCDDSVKRDLI